MNNCFVYQINYNYYFFNHELNSVFLPVTEDAKRMAIKEEAYDPGYEAAFGGAYGEGGPGPEEGQSNGH